MGIGNITDIKLKQKLKCTEVYNLEISGRKEKEETSRQKENEKKIEVQGISKRKEREESNKENDEGEKEALQCLCCNQSC